MRFISAFMCMCCGRDLVCLQSLRSCLNGRLTDPFWDSALYQGSLETACVNWARADMQRRHAEQQSTHEHIEMNIHTHTYTHTHWASIQVEIRGINPLGKLPEAVEWRDVEIHSHRRHRQKAKEYFMTVFLPVYAQPSHQTSNSEHSWESTRPLQLDAHFEPYLVSYYFMKGICCAPVIKAL